MSVIQIIAISLFVYLGSIGSIVGNTIGWYTLGRPWLLPLSVGVIMGDLQTAMIVGIALQIMYMGNVTPGGAVAWDLVLCHLHWHGRRPGIWKGMESTQVIGLAVVFARNRRTGGTDGVEPVLCPEPAFKPPCQQVRRGR